MTTDIVKEPPLIVRLIKKRFEAGEKVFLRLGRLHYTLRHLWVASHDGKLPLGWNVGPYWIGEFSTAPDALKTNRRFYDDADTMWTLKYTKDGWELQKRQQVVEARRRKVIMSEPLDMKAEFILKVIDSEFQKERGVPAKINLFGRGMSGTIIKVQRNTDNSVTFQAQLPPDPSGEIWTSVLTVTNSDFQHMRLTKQNGRLMLVSDEQVREEKEHSLPIFVTMLRRLLAKGKTVYARAWVDEKARKDVFAMVTAVHFNEDFRTIDIDVKYGDGETDQFGYTTEEAEAIKFKDDDGVWYITDLEGNYR